MRLRHFLTCLLLAAPAAWAALGAVPAASSQAGTPVDGMPVRVQQLESGTTVREYLDAAGTVWAVTWSGPFLPDLRALLGSWFPAFTQAQAASRGTVALRTADLAVFSSGSMGRFQGRAWLPAHVPAGVNPEQLP